MKILLERIQPEIERERQLKRSESLNYHKVLQSPFPNCSPLKTLFTIDSFNFLPKNVFIYNITKRLFDNFQYGIVY